MRLSVCIIASICIGATIASASEASATEAYATSSSWLRTGPDYKFPAITRIPRNATVDIIGCTEGYRWCDVIFNHERGWFAGRRLQTVYNGRRDTIPNLAPLLGLLILQFSFRDYWDNNYRERPWYTDKNQQRWQNWQFPAPLLQTPRTRPNSQIQKFKQDKRLH